jgi:nucleoside-diphosphate-sugar epimerase
LYEERFFKPVKFINGDIRDTNKLINVSNDYDVIILLAALVGDPACSVDVALTEQINYTAIKSFCEGVDKSKHVIFMSTCSVYGAQEGLLDESSATNPLSSYASTKLASEKYVSEINGTIFRLGTVYGLGDRFSRLRMDLVVNVLTMRAFYEGVITINGGEQWRPIISVVDISNYILEAVEKSIRGLYILSYDNVVIRDLGVKVASLIPNTKINYVEIPFQDARNYKVSNAKASSIFKYKPSISVEHEVKRFLQLFSEGRIKDPNDQVYHNGAHIKSLKAILNTWSSQK